MPAIDHEYRLHHKLQYCDEEIYDVIVDLVGYIRDVVIPKDKENFRKVVSETFRIYMEIVRDTVADEEAINKAKYNCDYIKKILKALSEGLHSRAFRQLKNLLETMVGTLYVDIPKDSVFFRMRDCEKRKSLTREDIFHIPLKKIREIKTQRYSAPGYPCLYLGNSLYACWEEMDRPDIDKVLVSCFKNQKTVKLVDLRIPTLKSFFANGDKYITLFPLILACSVPVINTKDIYKPEYSLPQLMLEWVISNRREKGAIGIYYTSVFKNKDFFVDLTSEWDNMAIPVQNPLSNKKFCPHLTELFKLTKPTCYEYENMLGNIKAKIEFDDEHENDYTTTQFSRLEELLKKKHFDVVDTAELD